MATLRLQDIFGGETGGFEPFSAPHWLERGSASLRLDGVHLPDHVRASADLSEPRFAAAPQFDAIEAKADGGMVICYGGPGDGVFAGL